MFGTAKSNVGIGIDWIIIKVNLTDVFDNPCTEDQYKKWSPSGEGQKNFLHVFFGFSFPFVNNYFLQYIAGVYLGRVFGKMRFFHT